VCTPADHAECIGKEAWWFDSCGEPDTKIADCAVGCYLGECTGSFYQDAEFRTTSEGQSFWCPAGGCNESEWGADMGGAAHLFPDDTSTGYTIHVAVSPGGWRSICWTPPGPVDQWVLAQARVELRGEVGEGAAVCGTYALWAGADFNARERLVIPQAEAPSASYSFSPWAPVAPPLGALPVCVTVENGPVGGNDCPTPHGIRVFKVWMQVEGHIQP